MSTSVGHEPRRHKINGAPLCDALKKDGNLCGATALAGKTKCFTHVGMKRAQAKLEGKVVTELAKWGIDGHTTLRDAGEVLLRMVTQSAYRVELYARLLGEAYEAAQRLRNAYDVVSEVVVPTVREDAPPQVRQAAADVERIFKVGGVGALIGFKWDTDRFGNPYKVEEAIRGLVQLELMERKLCADFAAKAVAAGLAERQVRIAEQQGMLIVGMLRRIADRLGLTAEQQTIYAEVVGEELRQIGDGQGSP